MSEHEVRLVLARPGRGSQVIVDGLDLSKMCVSVNVSASATDVPLVTLTLLPQVVTIEGIAEVTGNRDVLVDA